MNLKIFLYPKWVVGINVFSVWVNNKIYDVNNLAGLISKNRFSSLSLLKDLPGNWWCRSWSLFSPVTWSKKEEDEFLGLQEGYPTATLWCNSEDP